MTEIIVQPPSQTEVIVGSPSPVIIGVGVGQGGARGPQGTQGPQGVQGVQGTSGLEKIVAYTHIQGAASNTWYVTHNLGFYPNITVVDSGGTIYEGEIDYVSNNAVTLTFSAAFSGKAYLS